MHRFLAGYQAAANQKNGCGNHGHADQDLQKTEASGLMEVFHATPPGWNPAIVVPKNQICRIGQLRTCSGFMEAELLIFVNMHDLHMC